MLKSFSVATLIIATFACAPAAQADHKHGKRLLAGLAGLTVGIIIGNKLAKERHSSYNNDGDNDDEYGGDFEEVASGRPSCVPEGWGGIFPHAEKVNYKGRRAWRATVPENAENGRKYEYYKRCEYAGCDGAEGYRCTGMLGYK